MQNIVRGLAALGALIWSSAAWAVVGETAVNVSNAGAPIAGATISIKPVARTAPSPVTAAQRPARVAPPRVTAKGDGTYILRYDDELHRGMLFDVTVTMPSGQRRTLRGLSIDQIRAGIDVASPGSPATAVAFPSSPVMPLPGSPSISFFGICNGGSFGISEVDTISGAETFQSTNRGTGCGGGVTLTLDSLYSNGTVALSPFASGAYLGQDLRHTFAGGSFISEEIKFVGTLGMQLGVFTSANAQLYLLGGLALVNKEFTIDFGAPNVSTSNQWLWGGTIGGGLSWSPSGFQVANRPLKLFVQYQHIFVQDGEIRNPAASPLFAYTFSNDMDVVTLGVSIPLGGSPR